jgi:dual specificity phosphatase 12
LPAAPSASLPGITNTAGGWVTPAFQLHLSRLDEMRPRGGGPGGPGGPGGVPGLRLPALLAERRRQAAEEAGARGRRGRGAREPGGLAGICWAVLWAIRPYRCGVALFPRLPLIPRRPPPHPHPHPPGPGDLLSDLSLEPGAGAGGGAAADCADGACCAAGGAANGAAAAAAAEEAAAEGGQAGARPYFRHLVLDCDGVLVDTEAASCEALHQAILEVTGLDIPHRWGDARKGGACPLAALAGWPRAGRHPRMGEWP